VHDERHCAGDRECGAHQVRDAVKAFAVIHALPLFCAAGAIAFTGGDPASAPSVAALRNVIEIEPAPFS
jgi:hypothetical protein